MPRERKNVITRNQLRRNINSVRLRIKSSGGRETDRQTDRQRDRQTDRDTERQNDRDTERQTDRKKDGKQERHREAENLCGSISAWNCVL